MLGCATPTLIPNAKAKELTIRGLKTELEFAVLPNFWVEVSPPFIHLSLSPLYFSFSLFVANDTIKSDENLSKL